MGSFLKGDIAAYDPSSPYLAGYNRPSSSTVSETKLPSKSIYDSIVVRDFHNKQAQAAKDYNANAGNRNPLQYDIEGTELAGEEPTFSLLNQRMTYDPMDLGSVDYLGRATVAGPNLGYEPEDMYQGEKESMSMSDWLKNKRKKYGRDLATAAIAATNAATSKPAQAQGPSISPRGSAASYAPPGRLGAGPYAPVNPRPDYQTLAQNAFRNALVEYILKNPKQNIKGML